MNATPPDTPWADLGPIEALEPLQGVEVDLSPGRPMALFRVGDLAYALAPRCPHAGAPLARGDVDPSNLAVTCPRLGCLRWKIQLIDGACSAGANVWARTYPTRVEGGRVMVALPAPLAEGGR